jgi:serine-type D-Ala-D-Ala carboxypeptidase/endopeptidase (penicillin-binding protein 4)
MHRRARHALLLTAALASTHPVAALATPPDKLPASVQAALSRQHLPASSLHAWVMPSGGTSPVLSWRSDQPANPASVMKLVTTYAALSQLGPSFTWKTTLKAYGQLAGDTLHGSVWIRGGGDPKLVVERLEPMLQSLREAGVRQIAGDMVLDHRAFTLGPTNPADFDGEPLRPYNSTPDALLINFKSLVMTFTPDAAAGVARVRVEPPMAGVQMDAQVPLGTGPCGDWRGQLRATVADPAQLRFFGSYPMSCGEREWPTAYADPASHAARAVAGMWQRLGGGLSGSARDWQTPDKILETLNPVYTRSFDSLPLSDIVRDVNKFSNNVMAQHLLLTLGLQAQPALARADTRAAGRQAVLDWWRVTFPRLNAPVLDNGSGLSRQERIRADALGPMLLHALQSPVSREFTESLPISGQDKALARRADLPAGLAWLKTGTLRDVSALAGYVRGENGVLYAVVAIINHPNAATGRPALDALVNWVARQ